MKGLIKRFTRRIRTVHCAIFALTFAAVIAERQASATIYTLSDQNSSIGLNLGTSAGMTGWNVDSVNQVNQQWFWFRVGPSGSQSDLTAITTTPFVTTLGSKQLTALYTNSSYGVQLTYSLTGQAAGSGRAGLTESIRMYNFTGASLDFHSFMYSDFVVGGAGQAGNQHVQLGTVSGVSTAVQTLGSPAIGSNTVTATIPASRVEAAPFNQTLNELTTVNGLALNNNTSAGPANPTWAWEWDLTLNPGTSSVISVTDNLQVPEPSSMALVLLGLASATIYRHRRGRLHLSP